MVAVKRNYKALLLVIVLVVGGVFTLRCSTLLPYDQSEYNIEPATIEGDYSSAYLCRLFDELDSKVNEGKGYSEYLNTSGFPTGALLAWSESYLMQAYANMYRATGNVKYLDKLHDHTKSVLAQRDDKIGRKDYKGEIVPSWGATKYSRNSEYTHLIIITSMITYPMLEFIDLIKEEELEYRYQNIEEILKQVEESISSFQEEYISDEKGGYYQFADESPIAYGQKMVPTNSAASAGRCFVLLYKITGKTKYLERATELARTFKNSLIIDKNGAYVWGYRPYPIGRGNKVEDISHGILEVDFARLCYENGAVFSEKDMETFAKTFHNFVKEDKIFDNVDGTGSSNIGVAALNWGQLAKFDKSILAKVIYWCQRYNIPATIQYFQEDWWGLTMLSLSRLVLCQSNFE